jgi:hypothetical protein
MRLTAVNALQIAKDNGHNPGYLFSSSMCFCKNCNAILTYCYEKSNCSGLYFTKCTGENQ